MGMCFGRLGTIEGLERPMAFLASAKSPFLPETAIAIDGGKRFA
jgi:NAD(P)-dependent dehydrogenase (short-subunit alcohol dehydrogenase family)